MRSPKTLRVRPRDKATAARQAVFEHLPRKRWPVFRRVVSKWNALKSGEKGEKVDCNIAESIAPLRSGTHLLISWGVSGEARHSIGWSLKAIWVTFTSTFPPNEMKTRTSSKPNACFVLKRRRARNWPKAELKSLKDKQKDSPRTSKNKSKFAPVYNCFPCLVFAF